MSYADQKMGGNRLVVLIIVAALHVVLAYGLVTGLAFEAVKQVTKRVTTIDIEEPDEPEVEPPPPPPEQKQVAPPPVAPPPPISVAPAPPQIVTTPVILPPKPSAPPPPPPAAPPKPPVPRGNPGSWAGPDDYPSRALREEREGVTRFTVTVDADGKVANCQVTGSSGHADLDEATCKNISRRGRFKPSTDSNGNPVTGTWSSAVRWQMPR